MFKLRKPVERSELRKLCEWVRTKMTLWLRFEKDAKQTCLATCPAMGRNFYIKTLCTLRKNNECKTFDNFWPFTKSYQIINNYVLLSHLLVIDNDDDPVKYLPCKCVNLIDLKIITLNLVTGEYLPRKCKSTNLGQLSTLWLYWF